MTRSGSGGFEEWERAGGEAYCRYFPCVLCSCSGSFRDLLLVILGICWFAKLTVHLSWAHLCTAVPVGGEISSCNLYFLQSWTVQWTSLIQTSGFLITGIWPNRHLQTCLGQVQLQLCWFYLRIRLHKKMFLLSCNGVWCSRRPSWITALYLH